jgi:hypothetical protein
VNVGSLPPKVILWGLFVLVVGGFLYFWNAQSELEEQRRAVMTKQRATAKILAPKLIPMRDTIEKGVQELAAPGKERVSAGVDWAKIVTSPGVYMRARLEDAKDLETLRKVSSESLRDGFTACLIRDPSAKLPTSGKECRESSQCEPGQFCNEYKACQRPSSPFNMRMLYRALHVLSDQWVNELREAGTEYAITAYDRSLDSTTKIDLPIAIEVYQRSKYAIVVLDEDPKGGLPQPLSTNEFESAAERVQRVAHQARIGVWELPSGKLLARVRAQADGELRDVGTRRAPAGVESEAVRARQANNCALALDFQSQLAPEREADLDEKSGETAGEPASAGVP